MNDVWKVFCQVREGLQAAFAPASMPVAVATQEPMVTLRFGEHHYPWREVWVNGVPWPLIHAANLADWPRGLPAEVYLGQEVRVTRVALATWYDQMILVHPGNFSFSQLEFLRDNLGWSEVIGIAMTLLPAVPARLEGLALADDGEVYDYFRWLKEISVDRLFSPTERTYTFVVPERCTNRPVPTLFALMPKALEAIGQVEAWGPGCWERAAARLGNSWNPNATYIGKSAYESVIYSIPNVWYPQLNFAAMLTAEIEELEQETLHKLKELRDRRRSCVKKFQALVEAANAATRGKSGSIKDLRQALREAGLYK